ncbi:MAG: glycosyltransferase family 4 protein [Bryobacterales bacterium]|nr:glycosyltransferase family 4 protein [Bryobacterales bacterium]
MTTVIWIDWYSYHVSRFRALFEHRFFKGQVTGIELVGGCGVHRGMQFRDAERTGLPIYSLFPQADWDQTGPMSLAWAVWRKLDELRPSSVLVPGWYTAPALAAAAWARLHGKRSILMSETTEQDHARVWWKESIKRLLIRLLFDFAVAGGKPHVRYLTQLGFPPDRIARFYDVVDNVFYREETAHVRQSSENSSIRDLPHPYFLYVGRLAPEKNVSTCLSAFARYRKLGGTWSFVLVGDGAEREALEKQSSDFGIGEHVLFAGHKASKDTAVYYAFAGCFILPSTREPWGLVVNEAMASGLPLIVSERCGCAEDLVEPGRNGYLFDPSNNEELTDRMLTVSTSSQATLDAMRQRSQEIIADYSPDHWAAEVVRLVQTNLVPADLIQAEG